MSDDIKPEKGMRKLYATALELGPLVLFFAANAKWGIFIGTGVFIVATAIALPCYRWLEGRWPIMPLVGGFFVLVFGGLTDLAAGRDLHQAEADDRELPVRRHPGRRPAVAASGRC